jgi:hypothetical protein
VRVSLSASGDAANAAARTLYPDAAFTRYVLSFTPGPSNTASSVPANVTVDAGESVFALELPLGTWTIKAVGCAGETALAEGSADVTVQYENPRNVSIVVATPVSSAQKGFFRYSVSYPGLTPDTARLTLALLDGGGTPVVNDIMTAPTGTIDCAAGFYLAVLEINAGTPPVTVKRTETVHIYPGTATAGEFVFSKYDFIPVALAGTANLTVNKPYYIAAYSDALYTELLGRSQAVSGGAWSLNAVLEGIDRVYFRAEIIESGELIYAVPAGDREAPAEDQSGIALGDLSIVMPEIQLDLIPENTALDDSLYGNGDGLVNPGETVFLDVRIKNDGAAAAWNLNAQLSVSGPGSGGITVNTGSRQLGHLQAGEYATLTSGPAASPDGAALLAGDVETAAFKFSASSDYQPASSPLTVTVTITDFLGNTWAASADLETGSVAVSLYEAGTAAELTTALSQIQSGSAGECFIGITGSFASAPVDLNGSGFGGKTIILRSRGASTRELSLSGTGSLFTIGENVNFILRNIILSGSGSNNAPLVKVSGRLVLDEGGIIMNNTNKIDSSTQANASVSGGGVFVDNGGSFEMNSGSVSGNQAYVRNGRSVANSRTEAYSYGGGIYVEGGGSFVLNGGSISGNKAYTESDSAVSGASAGSYGGGVYVKSGGSIELNGGSVSDNQARASADGSNPWGGSDAWAGAYGGGVCVEGQRTGNGSVVSGNTVFASIDFGMSQTGQGDDIYP